MKIPKFVISKSKDEDTRRKEFILNIVLLSLLILTLIGVIIQVVYIILSISPEKYEVIPFFINVGFFLFFLFLYSLLRKGYFNLSAFLILAIFYAMFLYMSLKWGVDLPAAILFSVLIIVMSGILINSRTAFFLTIIVIITITTINTLHRNNIIEANTQWRLETWTSSNLVMVSMILLIIAVISWLSNKEIEKSLNRVKKSEAALMNERNMLELRIRERTKELQESEAEKMTQFYQFAEYGKLSSGLFHDLVNPLTAISLNIEKIKATTKISDDLKMIEVDLNRTRNAINKMENLIGLTRKQISCHKINEFFSVNKEIEDAIEILSYKIKNNRIQIFFKPEKEFRIVGNPIRFNQIATNLISNAIDAYQDKIICKKIVKISLVRREKMIELMIIDHGQGIPKDLQSKIFTIFSTKSFNNGTGVGLYLTKNLIEKEFDGRIKFNTKEGRGTVFIITIPIY